MSGPDAAEGGIIADGLEALTQRTPTPMEGIATGKVWRGADLTINQIALAAGATLPTHTAPRQVVIHLADGSATFTLGDEAHHIETGGIIVLPPGIEHSVTAITQTRLVLTLIG